MLSPSTHTRRLMFAVLATVAAVLLLVTSNGTSATQLTANPGTLNSVFASAKGGDTIELASGDYGTFNGGTKSGRVTLKPQAGAHVTMELYFAPASNITIDGVTITDAVLTDSRTRDITIRNSDIPGQVVLRTDELQNANILLDHNDHHDFDKCGDCGEGRIFLPGKTSEPSGITIKNSEFRGGLSDGIQNGSAGTRILNNNFHNLEIGSPEGVHSDAIQLIGSRNTVIRGNYFHDLPDVPAIMAPDGADHEVIEDNVIAGEDDGYPYITLFSDNGSTIRHNTFADGNCTFNLPCGILRIGAKSGDSAGIGTVVEDNILSDISIETGSVARRSHNLLGHDAPGGEAESRGRPSYVGGVAPTSYAGFALASGSRGKGNASDGLDRGARIDGSASPGGRDRNCRRAAAKVNRAKHKVKRAERRVDAAHGHHRKDQAKHKLKRAKRKLRQAKHHKRHACR